MTKRNIELRAKLDSIIEEGDEIKMTDTEIDFQGYTFELNNIKQEKELFPNDNESSKEDYV